GSRIGCKEKSDLEEGIKDREPKEEENSYLQAEEENLAMEVTIPGNKTKDQPAVRSGTDK
ncbi:hypothetical protein KI387_012372, partial [Taxus chinensis]